VKLHSFIKYTTKVSSLESFVVYSLHNLFTYSASKELWLLETWLMGAGLHAADMIKCEEYVMFCGQLCRQFYLNLIVVLWVPEQYIP